MSWVLEEETGVVNDTLDKLLTDRGRMVRPRAEWTVTAIHPDGTISVDGRSGCVRLPSEYVAEHVDLADARTGAGAKGRTLDVAILYLDGPTDVRNLYLPMTRGRSTNEVFVATTGEQTALDVVAQSIATDWIDRPALARQAELNRCTPPDVTISHSRRILARWRSGPEQPTPTASPRRDRDDRSPSRRILDDWQGREPQRTVDDDRATEPARPDSEASGKPPAASTRPTSPAATKNSDGSFVSYEAAAKDHRSGLRSSCEPPQLDRHHPASHQPRRSTRCGTGLYQIVIKARTKTALGTGRV